MLVALICGNAAYAMPGDMGSGLDIMSGDIDSGSGDISDDMGSGSVDMGFGDFGGDRFFWGNDDDDDEEGRLLLYLNRFSLCFIIHEPQKRMMRNKAVSWEVCSALPQMLQVLLWMLERQARAQYMISSTKEKVK